MQRQDVLAFTRAFYAASPTFRRAQVRVRVMLPAIMFLFWAFVTLTSGFSWFATAIYFGVALLWFLIYPSRYVRSVEKYSEKMIDEGSHGKSFGAYELTLSESGLHSTGPSGTSTFHWSAVDRATLTDSYLFIFLNGPIGYPIPIKDIGSEAARDAEAYIESHRATEPEQDAAEEPQP